MRMFSCAATAAESQSLLRHRVRILSSIPIYLDHNSTTPLDPSVAEAMLRAWNECGGNPASQHSFGRKARRTVEAARQDICTSLGAQPYGMEADRLIFTSGG